MKKISAIIICLLIFLTCTLTGCAGFSVNRVKYYNEVVATVGTTEITRFDLLNAYNSNGNYYTQNGQSESEAMADVLDLLIDREAVYQHALNFKPELGANPYIPTRYQINEIIKSIFDSVDGQIDEYIVTAKHILDIEIAKGAEDETEAEVFKREDYNYKKRASIYKDGADYVIKYNIEKEPEDFEYTLLIDEDVLESYNPQKPNSQAEHNIVEEIKNKYLQHLNDHLAETEQENATAIYKEILKSISTSLINYEFYLRDANGNPFSKDTDSLLYRYFERLFKEQIKSQYLTNYQEYYLAHENLSLQKLIQAYQEISDHDYEKYNGFSADYKTDMKNTSTEFEKIFYHPNIDEEAQFGYFLHTLFQFSDDQKAQIDNLKTKYDGKTFQEFAAEYKEKIEDPKLTEAAKDKLSEKFNEYKNAYTEIVLKTEVVFRQDGKEIENPENNSLREVFASKEYQDLVKNQDMYEFVDFMFAHTQDTATLTADAPYVVGSFDEAKGETYSTNSAMEEAFTMEAIKLMQAGKNNSISDIYSNGDFDVENLCITSYGVHILYYICPLYENDIPNNNTVYFDLYAQDRSNLYTSYMNPLSELKGKTYFDLLFDIVYPAGDSIFTTNTNYTKKYEEIIANPAREECGVEIFETRLKSTKTNF